MSRPGNLTDHAVAVLLSRIRQAAGLSEPGPSQFEHLAMHVLPDGAVGFSYAFDRDGHSQYDQTLRFSGCASLDGMGHWRIDAMQIEHVGIAVDYDPPAVLRGRPGK